MLFDVYMYFFGIFYFFIQKFVLLSFSFLFSIKYQFPRNWWIKNWQWNCVKVCFWNCLIKNTKTYRIVIKIWKILKQNDQDKKTWVTCSCKFRDERLYQNKNVRETKCWVSRGAKRRTSKTRLHYFIAWKRKLFNSIL